MENETKSPQEAARALLEAIEADATRPKPVRVAADALRAALAAEEGRVELAALRAENERLKRDADKFGDGIDWIQRAMQAEALLDAMREILASDEGQSKASVLSQQEAAAIDAALSAKEPTWPQASTIRSE